MEIHRLKSVDNMKLWLCGIISGDRKMIENTILPIIPYFDGIIFVVDSRAKVEDIQWLNTVKKEGKIIVKKWVNDHSHTSNEVIFSDIMKFPDYFVWVDQSDKLDRQFAIDLKENIEYFHDGNIGAFWIDHPLLVRYHTGVRFVGSPHWTCINILGKQINLTTAPGYKKESYIVNTRDILKSGFLSPIKYTFTYPPFSNHFQLLYSQFSQEIWAKHEGMRINFQLSCQQELGLDLTVESLKNYMINNVGKYPDWFESVIEDEINIKDAFRLFVLNQDWTELHNNRFNWSYFEYKKSGKIDQGKYDGYIGLFNEYKIKLGFEME